MESFEKLSRTKFIYKSDHYPYRAPAWQRLLGRLAGNGKLIVGLSILLPAIFVALFAPVVAPQDPNEQDISNRLAPPVWNAEGNPQNLLGTDQLGRDLLSRIIFGARISLIVGFSAVFMASTFGVFIGLFAGYHGGVVDEIIMRWIDIQLAFPFLLLAITMLAVLKPSIVNVILALAISGWVTYGRLVRGQVLGLREGEFVLAAKVTGCTSPRIIFSHLFPNVIGTSIVMATLQLGWFIIAESILSFLGLGLQPPTPSWGGIMSEGRQYIDIAWWIITFPGIVMATTVSGIGLLGDWLRDALDPRTRQ